MRVTNPMMSSQMLLNINRNTRRLNALYMQESTGKQIQFPSENPILAGRALKFRTSLEETEQYRRNVKQGLSWMDITQGAYKNSISVLQKINELCVQGASDPSGTWEDRQKVIAEIDGLINQLGAEMNVTYAGRYVFSGYRTDMPPIFVDTSSKSYQINQFFTGKNIENTITTQKLFNVTAVKIPKTATLTAVNGVTLPNASINIVNKKLSDHNAYVPGDNEIVYIQDTGEYVFGKNYIPTPPAQPNLTYTDGGPPVNVNVTTWAQDTAEPLINNVSVIKLPYTGVDISSISIGKYNSTTPKPPSNVTFPPYPVSGLGTIVAKDLKDPTAYQPAAGEINYIAETGEFILSREFVAEMNSYGPNESLLINYTKTGFQKGEPNPIVYFDCTDKAPGGKSYTMDDQNLRFEFGTNTRIEINSLGKDVLTATMYADLVHFNTFVKGITKSDTDKLTQKYKEAYPLASPEEINTMVNDQLSRESQLIETSIRDRFKNMIEMTQNFVSTVSYQETNLGVRMNRLSLINDRLDEDKITYKGLLSDNEDVDYMEVLMELNAAVSVYQASLKTGANIMQISLVDFLR